jgi:hypothetical protein
MSWITDNKGLGVWDFEKSSQKLSYNEGSSISTYADSVWNNDHSGVAISSTHKPCGYWTKNYIAPEPLSIVDKIFILNFEWLASLDSETDTYDSDQWVDDVTNIAPSYYDKFELTAENPKFSTSSLIGVTYV